MTHNEICHIAAKWLKRNNSRGGPGCKIALVEPKSGHTGEIPDAIGWNHSGYPAGCFVVEAKTSRSDFLSDFNKEHRSSDSNSLGNMRFYICPENIIKESEVPSGWGLLWINKKGHIKSIKNPFSEKNYYKQKEIIKNFWWDSNKQKEVFILAGLISRIDSPEKMNEAIKSANRERERVFRLFEKEKKEKEELAKKLCFEMFRERPVEKNIHGQ